MREETESRYLSLWQKILETERQIENIRQKLHKNNTFNTERAFMLININKDGFLSVHQLK